MDEENVNINSSLESAPTGLMNSLNRARNELDVSENYRNAVPEITSETSFAEFVGPILQYPTIFNEFCNVLVQKIAYSQFVAKSFNNPFRALEGDAIPLGYIGEEIFINPALGRDYDCDDFAGLLKKYEADVKVQYQTINFDKQYPVTIIRNKLKQAMTSWSALASFIGGITQSLYNGSRIDEYNNVKALVTRAYHENAVQIEVIDKPTNSDKAKAFVEKLRTLYLDFQTPSSDFNAWKKVGGYGRAIETFIDKPEDVYIIMRNDIRSKVDVEVLAAAFNMNKADLMGRIFTVKDFDLIDRKTGAKLFDGSNIHCIIADKAWFKIKPQDAYMEDFRNANNRSLNYYLNVTKLYSYSLFANAVVLASAVPEIAITGLDFKASEGISIDKVGDIEGLDITVTPINSTTPTIEYSSGDEDVFTVEASESDNRHCIVTATGTGTATLTATAGNVTATVQITVENA